MDIFAIFFVALISVMFGIILTLSVQYYIFYIYLKKSPVATIASQKKTFDYFLPEVSIDSWISSILIPIYFFIVMPNNIKKNCNLFYKLKIDIDK